MKATEAEVLRIAKILRAASCGGALVSSVLSKWGSDRRAQANYLVQARAALEAIPEPDAPAWATPEAKAVLDWAEACLPIMERIGDGPGSQVIRAYLASIEPKTVTLPERYVVDNGHRTWAFVTRSVADKLARTQGGYVRVLPAETREVKP